MNNQQDPPIDDKPEPIDPNYVRNLEERIANQQLQFRKQELLLEKIANKQEETTTQPAPRNVEAERNSFYTDPVGALEKQLSARDERILGQMRQMIAPLAEVATNFKSTSAYDSIKASLMHDPVFGKGLRDSDVVRVVDMIVKQEGFELSEESVKSAIAQTMGVKAMGGLKGGNGRNVTPPDNDDTNRQERIDPPQIPTARTRSNMPDTRKELTEDDRIAMKFANLRPGNPDDEKEYWNLISDDKMTLSVHKKGDK